MSVGFCVKVSRVLNHEVVVLLRLDCLLEARPAKECSEPSLSLAGDRALHTEGTKLQKVGSGVEWSASSQHQAYTAQYIITYSAESELCGKMLSVLTYRGGYWHGKQLSELKSIGMDFADKHLKLASDL